MVRPSTLCLVHWLTVLPLLLDPHGLKFEEISDQVDSINVAKLLAKSNELPTQEEVDAYTAAVFDQEKDKANFRQYDEAEDNGPRKFYLYVVGLLVFATAA